jgi:hypothetical protein
MADRELTALRLVVESELARAGLVRTQQEIAHIVAERIALERDIAKRRGELNPLLGPDCFFERLRQIGRRQ